jgi:hypothetical protein
LEIELREQTKLVEHFSGISMGVLPENLDSIPGSVSTDLRVQAFRIKELSLQKESVEASYVTLFGLVLKFNENSLQKMDLPSHLHEEYHNFRASILRECYSILERDFLAILDELQNTQHNLKALQIRFDTESSRNSALVKKLVILHLYLCKLHLFVVFFLLN